MRYPLERTPMGFDEGGYSLEQGTPKHTTAPGKMIGIEDCGIHLDMQTAHINCTPEAAHDHPFTMPVAFYLYVQIDSRWKLTAR